jgi:putative hydrolase of the HAD superfamily
VSGTEHPLNIPGRVIVFDYGEVLSMSPSEPDRLALVDAAGAEAGAFWTAYWRSRDALDHGTISVPAYWAQVGSELGIEFGRAQVQRLWAADFRSWISVEPGSIDILYDLVAGGTRIALLSNAGFDFGDAFRYSPTGALFEQVFVSAELGLLKPDPEIYRHVARELGIEPAEMVFIDNKKVNVEGAESIGVTGHHFTGVEGLRAFLTTLSEGSAA